MRKVKTQSCIAESCKVLPRLGATDITQGIYGDDRSCRSWYGTAQNARKDAAGFISASRET